jgi:aryl-alcohol dehydrogenase-like predicted oxidoreductase
MRTELWQRRLHRRTFLKLGVTTTAGAVLASWLPSIRHLRASEGFIPTRPLGKTAVPVTMVGLGGEGILRTWGRQREAVAVIERALNLGITYCDTAPAYSGSQDYYGAILRERRRGLFLASKTHDRSRDGSLRLLEESLRRLNTDHLDLWQLHDLESVDELDRMFSKGGAIHALEEAKADGRVRFVGITGHYDPDVLVQAIHRYPFETVLVALHAADTFRLSFIERLLPVANAHRLGVIGMKVVARGRLLRPEGSLTMRQALGYVLSLPISTAIVGFATPEEVEEAVEVARSFTPLSAQEMADLEALARPYAEPANWFKRPS